VKKATRHTAEKGGWGDRERQTDSTGVLSRRVLKNGEGSVTQQTQNDGKIKE
jgi:hypothetical protein